MYNKIDQKSIKYHSPKLFIEVHCLDHHTHLSTHFASITCCNLCLNFFHVFLITSSSKESYAVRVLVFNSSLDDHLMPASLLFNCPNKPLSSGQGCAAAKSLWPEAWGLPLQRLLCRPGCVTARFILLPPPPPPECVAGPGEDLGFQVGPVSFPFNLSPSSWKMKSILVPCDAATATHCTLV